MTEIKKFLDQDGITHLWSKVIEQDYTNNQMLMDVIDVIDETKADKAEIPSIENLAAKTYVDDAISNIVHPSIDLSGFATKSFVQNAIKSIAPEDLGTSFMIPNPVDKSHYAGKKIACIGDSVTAGVGANGNPYVTQLGAALGTTMVNLGASGTVLCTGGHRSCNIGKLTEGSLGGADIVTILMGINDWDQAKEGYYNLGDINSTDTSTLYGAIKMWCDRIVELKKTASLAHTKFYFMTPLQTSWNNSKGGHNWDQNKVNIHGFKLRDLCQAIIDVCALYEIPVIDLNLYSGIYYNSADDQTANTLGGDGIHPNEAGHTKITEAIIRGLEQNAEYASIVDTLYYILAFAAHELKTELSYPVNIQHKVENKEILITGITLPVNTLTLNAGESHTLTPALVPADTTQTNIVWETSNANIASVREGVVTAIAEGSVTITCKSADNANVFATVAVTVNAATSTDLTALILSDETITVNAGESHTMSVAFVPAATEQTNVTWSCDDSDVAEITPAADGKTCVVTAKNVGQCYITVTSNDNAEISDSCLFTTSEVGEEEPDEPAPASLFNLGSGATYNEETGLLTSGSFASGNTNTAVYTQPLKPGMEIEVEYGCTNDMFTTFGVDTTSNPEDVILAQGKYATGLFNFYYDIMDKWDPIYSLTSGTINKNTMIGTGNKANPKIAILKRDADGVFSGSVNGVDCVIPANAHVTTAQDTENLYVFFGGTNGGATTNYWKINYFGALRNEPDTPVAPEEPETPVEPENPDVPVEPTDTPWVLGAKTRYNAKEDYVYGTGMFQTGTDYVAIHTVPLTANMEVEIEGYRDASDNGQYTVCGLTDSLVVEDTHCGNNRYAEGVYNVYYDAPSSQSVISYLRDGPQRLSGTTGNKDNPRICTFKRDADGVITAYHAGTLLNIPAVEAANNAENLYVMIAGPGAASQWKIKYIGELR